MSTLSIQRKRIFFLSVCQQCQYKEKEYFSFCMSTPPIQRKRTFFFLYVDTVDTRLIRYWCCTIEDREQRKDHFNSFHCIFLSHLSRTFRIQSTLSIQGSSSIDAVLLRKESKGRAILIVFTVFFSLFWVEHFEYSWHSRYKAHPVLMLYYWGQRAKEGLMHPNSFHCICWHCWYIQSNYNVDSNMKGLMHPNSFHCICWHCWYIQLNYNVDPNTKSSNYSKVRFKPLIYFELQQTSN